MNPVFEAATLVQKTFDEWSWDSCVIGAVAVMRWGEPRATRDVDVSLLSGIGDEDRFINRILTRFEPRYAEAQALARKARVLLVIAPNGIEIDISLAAFPLERQMIERATQWTPAPGAAFRTLCAEDVIAMKAFSARPRDWSDIEGVIVRQGGSLDWELITRELEELAEVKPEVDFVTQLRELRRQISSKGADSD